MSFSPKTFDHLQTHESLVILGTAVIIEDTSSW